MVSVIESEKLGNALNILDALNSFSYRSTSKMPFVRRYWIYCKIKVVIAFMDAVIV